MYRVADGRQEHGIALVVTMMVVAVLVGITGALIPLTSIETAITANHRRATQAFYAAEAALAWAIQELQGERSWAPVLSGARRSSLWVGGTQHRLADGATWDLAHVEEELQRLGAGAYGAGRGLAWRLYAHGPLDRVLRRESSAGVLFVAVWVADDPAETDDAPFRDTNGVLMLHVAAVGPSLSHRAVQATLTLSPTRRAVLSSWALVR